MAEQYDLVIIGAGPAGYMAAQESARRGMKTALIESRELGGTCLNRGCIPTKTILHAAGLYAQMKECGPLGIHAEGIRCDMAGIQAHKAEVIRQLRFGIASLMKKHKVTVYEGTGTILGAHEVQVRSAVRSTETAEVKEERREPEVLQAKYILIATGSVPAIPPIPGAGLPDVVNSDELLSKKELYPRLTIVGGGVIGMEFASIYSALGCKVTVLEFLDRILANMDREISQNLKMILKKRGVEIQTGAQVEEITRGENRELICRYAQKGIETCVESDGVLLAVGRRANTEGLFADAEGPGALGIWMERGRICTDEFGRTGVPNIYAVGDVTGGIQLAHAATAQALNAVAHMAGETGSLRTDLIPGCVYTDPEIGSIGLTPDEAKAQGLSVITKKYPMSANGKTVLTGQDRGFIKVVADADTRRILGAQLMCARATDMIGEFGTAIVNGLTLEQMASVVRPHPTFNEAVGEAVRDS